MPRRAQALLLAPIVAASGLLGCNALTGASDLELVACTSDCPPAADAAVDSFVPADTFAVVDATDAGDDATVEDTEVDAAEEDADAADDADATVEAGDADASDGAADVRDADAASDAIDASDASDAPDGDGCTVGCGIRVFTAVGLSTGSPTSTTPVTMGTIPAIIGKKIRILKIGICGDADTTSGPVRFVATDGLATTFSWAAGQSGIAATATYRLSPTPVTGAGSERGFSYQAVTHVGALSRAFTVRWDLAADFDVRYCSAKDEDGTSFGDPANSVRVWVKYQYE